MARGVAPSRLATSTFAPARISQSAASRSSGVTAQCNAVAPSTCGRLRSDFRARRSRSAVLSPRIIASATSLPSAPTMKAAVETSNAATHQAVQLTRTLDPLEPTLAVALYFTVNAEHVHHTQQQVARGNRFAGIRHVTAALKLSVGPSDENVRHVELRMLIRVPHVGAVERQRVVEQRPVAVGCHLELLGEVRQRRDVIAVQPGVRTNLNGIFLMVRSAVEAHAGAAVGEEIALR